MSGLWTTTKNYGRRFVGDGASHTRTGAERRMGHNRDPYYGNVAQTILDGPHGGRKYANSVLGKRGSKGASSQLLGGG